MPTVAGLDPKAMPKTPAGKVQLVHDLLNVPVEDDEGRIIGHESLITQEQARQLLDMPE